ncbi:MAG: hypothetical protein BroJett011_24320 [Chloroflexota bacterium]|nr:MAG: hypothetical protein BroJett011_24320 [Chloroflexota bacterium]
MELIRDLVRDLVGIIFPGGLLIIFTLGLFFGILIILAPLASFNLFTIADNSIGFSVLLIFSYVAGQSLRLRGLDQLEKVCTEEYRKRYKSKLSREIFDQAIEHINKEENDYQAGQSTLDKLKNVYEKFIDEFRIWEEFPYPYFMKARRLARLSTNYNEFFEKYDRQRITKNARFFNFCKTVIYEYSPSLKEELIRQEALVRLFSGIYYVIRYGKIVSVIVGLLHLAVIISYYLFRFSFLSYANLEYSYGIVILTVFAYIIFRYLNKEIITQLRFMRVKELDLAYDGFYLICQKNDFEIDNSEDQLQAKGQAKKQLQRAVPTHRLSKSL